MKWLAVIGTRETTPEMRRDIEVCVRDAVAEKWRIVSGGSTGVDTIATMTALKYGAPIRVYLPVPMEMYTDNLRERARAGKCLAADAEQTITHLSELRDHDANMVVEPNNATELTPEAFYARNERILQHADRVAAFHLTGNATKSQLPAGTLLSVQRARELGKPVRLHNYEIEVWA